MIVNATTKLLEDNVFETDVDGFKVTLDTGSKERKGQSPPQVILSAIGSCSAVDVIDIIRKKRKNVSNLTVKTTGDRVDENTTYPRKYNTINLHFILETTNASAADLEQAVKLSVDKYCSVAGMLSGNAKISHSTELVKI